MSYAPPPPPPPPPWGPPRRQGLSLLSSLLLGVGLPAAVIGGLLIVTVVPHTCACPAVLARSSVFGFSAAGTNFSGHWYTFTVTSTNQTPGATYANFSFLFVDRSGNPVFPTSAWLATVHGPGVDYGSSFNATTGSTLIAPGAPVLAVGQVLTIGTGAASLSGGALLVSADGPQYIVGLSQIPIP